MFINHAIIIVCVSELAVASRNTFINVCGLTVNLFPTMGNPAYPEFPDIHYRCPVTRIAIYSGEFDDDSLTVKVSS